nr:hypothetical protein [uncultured Pseudomonas sp.]
MSSPLPDIASCELSQSSLPLDNGVEGALGTPLQTAVKRADEQAFASSGLASLPYSSAEDRLA